MTMQPKTAPAVTRAVRGIKNIKDKALTRRNKYMNKSKECQQLSTKERVFLKALVEKNQERELCREKLDLVGYQHAQVQISTIMKQLEKAVKK